jgi:hypothetical protein
MTKIKKVKQTIAVALDIAAGPGTICTIKGRPRS